MSLQLTQKEKSLLQDQKSHEEMCVQKYSNYANQAQDPQLKQMFQQLAQKEQEHLNTVNQILSGKAPNMQSQQSSGQSSQGQTAGQSSMQNQQQSGMQSSQSSSGQNSKQSKSTNQMENGTTFNSVGTTPRPVTAETSFVSSSSSNSSDKDLCQDMLMTEKYVSSTYDTTVFECTDTKVRQALNHIQKEEQEHGEQIFNYMQQNGMYNPQ